MVLEAVTRKTLPDGIVFNHYGDPLCKIISYDPYTDTFLVFNDFYFLARMSRNDLETATTIPGMELSFYPSVRSWPFTDWSFV